MKFTTQRVKYPRAIDGVNNSLDFLDLSLLFALTARAQWNIIIVRDLKEKKSLFGRNPMWVIDLGK